MSTRIKKKFIEAKAIDGSKILFLNDESFKAVHAGQEVSLFKLNSSGKFVLEKLPEHSSDPQLDDELARKKYVDDRVNSESVLREADVDAEQSRAEGVEASLQSQINALSAGTSGDLAAEIAARIAGDQALAADIAEEVDILNDAINTLSTDVAAEQTARESGDSALDARLDVLEGSETTGGSVAKALKDAKDYTDTEQARAEGEEARIEGKVDQEILDREAAISNLKGSVSSGYDTLKKIEDKIENVLSNVDPAALDSLTEIVSAFQDADGDLTASITALSTSSSSALAAEVARAEAAEAALDSRLDVLEQDPVTKAYVDSKDLEEKTRAMGVESQLQSDLDSEESARIVGDNALDARLDVLETDPTTKTYVDGKVALLNSSIDDVDGYAQDIRDDLDQEILDRQTDVNAEETRAMAAESALQSEIDAEEAARIAAVSAEQLARESADTLIRSDFASADAAKLQEAKNYADQKVADLVNSAPAVLDTLKELADAINGDASFASTVASNIGTAKQEAKDYADSQLNALGERFVKMSKVLSGTDVSNKYFDLSHKGFEFSMVVSIDRLMLIQDLDYTISVVGGVSRVTFSDDFMNGPEAAESGDLVMVRYLKDVR